MKITKEEIIHRISISLQTKENCEFVYSRYYEIACEAIKNQKAIAL